MNFEILSDDWSDLDDFVNLKDILPSTVEDHNIHAEYLISEHFLVPGVITQYSDEHVLFKPYFSDEIFNVPYNRVRHLPDVAVGCKYEEVGNKVEVYLFDVKLNLHGWARCTVKSIVEDTYVLMLEQRKAFVIVQSEKIRTISTGAYLDNKYLYTFNVLVPRNLQNFANNIQVYDSFCKTIGDPRICYDIEKNSLVISSNNVGCESVARMLLVVHFANLTHRMLLTESIKRIFAKYERITTVDLLEQFEIHPDLLKYVIGKNCKNIREAEKIPGVTHIAMLKDIYTVKIYAQNKVALKKACTYLQLEKEKIEISTNRIHKVIGIQGQNLQRIAHKFNLRHIEIITSSDSTSEVAELEFIGTSANINRVKCSLQYYLNYLREFDEFVLVRRDGNQQHNPVFEDTNIKSSVESPAEGVSSETNANVENVEFMTFSENQGLMIYDENLWRGRARGRSSSPRRTRGGRCGYQTTQYRVDNAEGENSTNQFVNQFQQLTTNRSRSRGRGQGRGRGRGLLYALVDGGNSISSRESQNYSWSNEYHELAENESLFEAGDASTNRNEQELEREQRSGAIKRVPLNLQERDTSNQTAETQATPEKRKGSRQLTVLASDMQTWEYDNLSRVFYRRSSTNNNTDATGDSAAPENESEEI